MDTTDAIMDNNNNQDWRDVACKEHKEKQEIELQLTNTEDVLVKVRKELLSAQNYIAFLEHKSQELEHKYAVQNIKFQSQSFKLSKILDLLKKAKVVIQQRKQEYILLKTENLAITKLLQQKSEDLEEEIFIHNQTKQQLENACNKIMEITSTRPIPSKDSKDHEDQLEEYFMHKLLSTNLHEEQITENLLQADNDFMEQLLYLEQQYNPGKS